MKCLPILLLLFSQLVFSSPGMHCQNAEAALLLKADLCKKEIEAVEVARGRKDDNDGYTHSMWVEPNFVDTEYSVLFESVAVKEIEDDDDFFDPRWVFGGWTSYRVKANVVEVYKGELIEGTMVDLLVHTSMLSKGSQEAKINGHFILSFCKSERGVFYNSRDFLITTPAPGNISKFRDIKKSGTDYEGSGDCSGNYPELDPDTQS